MIRRQAGLSSAVVPSAPSILLCLLLPLLQQQRPLCLSSPCSSGAGASVLLGPPVPSHGVSGGGPPSTTGAPCPPRYLLSFLCAPLRYLHPASRATHHYSSSSSGGGGFPADERRLFCSPNAAAGPSDPRLTRSSSSSSSSLGSTDSSKCSSSKSSKDSRKDSSRQPSLNLNSGVDSIAALSALPLRVLHGISTAREAALQREAGCRSCLDLLLHFLPVKYLRINTVSSTAALREAAGAQEQTGYMQQRRPPQHAAASGFAGTESLQQQQQQQSDPPDHYQGGPITFIGCLERISHCRLRGGSRQMLSTAKVRGLLERPPEASSSSSSSSTSSSSGRRCKKEAEGRQKGEKAETLRVTWIGKFRQLLQLRKGQVVSLTGKAVKRQKSKALTMLNPKAEILAPSAAAFCSSASAAASDEAADTASSPVTDLLPPLPLLSRSLDEGEEAQAGRSRLGREQQTHATNTPAPPQRQSARSPPDNPPYHNEQQQQQQHQQQQQQEDLLPLPAKCLYPVYLPVASVPTKVLKEGISRLLSVVAALPDPLPPSIRKKRQLLSRACMQARVLSRCSFSLSLPSPLGPPSAVSSSYRMHAPRLDHIRALRFCLLIVLHSPLSPAACTPKKDRLLAAADRQQGVRASSAIVRSEASAAITYKSHLALAAAVAAAAAAAAAAAFSEAMRRLHAPRSGAEIPAARRRAAFDLLLWMHLASDLRMSEVRGLVFFSVFLLPLRAVHADSSKRQQGSCFFCFSWVTLLLSPSSLALSPLPDFPALL
ncbi:hypothetical protein Efla_002779 [Eimeria flavescens]